MTVCMHVMLNAYNSISFLILNVGITYPRYMIAYETDLAIRKLRFHDTHFMHYYILDEGKSVYSTYLVLKREIT